MIAICPNGCELKRFVTVVHVTEDWIVDQTGQFQEIHASSEAHVVAEPNPNNTWLCLECGSEAEAKVS